MAREEGFVAAAIEAGVEVIVERFGPTRYQSGVILAQRLLTREARPDAIFCANDLLPAVLWIPPVTSLNSLCLTTFV